jgi:hypothetical protein
VILHGYDDGENAFVHNSEESAENMIVAYD